MYRNIQGSGLIEIFPGYASSLLRVSILFFCILNSPQGTLARVAAMVDGLLAAMPLFTDVASDSLCPHVHYMLSKRKFVDIIK